MGERKPMPDISPEHARRILARPKPSPIRSEWLMRDEDAIRRALSAPPKEPHVPTEPDAGGRVEP